MKKEFKVKFTVFGHKFTTSVKANNKQEAYAEVRLKIQNNTVFDSVEEVDFRNSPEMNNIFDIFKNSGVKL